MEITKIKTFLRIGKALKCRPETDLSLVNIPKEEIRNDLV